MFVIFCPSNRRNHKEDEHFSQSSFFVRHFSTWNSKNENKRRTFFENIVFCSSFFGSDLNDKTEMTNIFPLSRKKFVFQLPAALRSTFRPLPALNRPASAHPVLQGKALCAFVLVATPGRRAEALSQGENRAKNAAHRCALDSAGELWHKNSHDGSIATGKTLRKKA